MVTILAGFLSYQTTRQTPLSPFSNPKVKTYYLLQFVDLVVLSMNSWSIPFFLGIFMKCWFAAKHLCANALYRHFEYLNSQEIIISEWLFQGQIGGF